VLAAAQDLENELVALFAVLAERLRTSSGRKSRVPDGGFVEDIIRRP